MGVELAVRGVQTGNAALVHFADTIVVKIKLGTGAWAIMGRVILHNGDGDPQWVTAKIVHDANVVLDNVTMWASRISRYGIALQATLKTRKTETVTLICNTYKGGAEFGSLLAIKVDDVDNQ